MATGQQFQQPLQQASTSQPGQYVPQMTAPKDSKNRSIPAVRYFSIATLVIAFLWCIMGIIAIVIEAKDSYVGDPIWSGVFFLLPTGLLGLGTYWKRNSICLKVMYLLMSIFSCIVCAHLVFYMSINAIRERHYYYYGAGTRCYPWPGFDNDYNYEYFEECKFSTGGRVAVDVIICLLAFIQFVLTIVSLAFTCYGTCLCCYNCCRPAPPPAVVQYTAQNGTCQLVSVGGHSSQAGYQPVSLMMVQQAPTAGQVVNMPGQQTQPVYMPTAPPVAVMQQQPVNVTPPSYGSPTMAGATADGTPVIAPDEKQPGSGQPDLTVSYGQTASDDFHDEKNLIETV